MSGIYVNNLLLTLLLLLALGAAWMLGRRSADPRMPGREDVSRDYFVGLNYLLNDEPDEAVDNFINALEINSHTLDTHLALATLLRRRGKVDKSIVICQSVLSRPGLSRQDANRVKVELVKNHISAGLLDRAEALVEELSGEDLPETRCDALSLGINLYQLEKDWEKAVSAARELLKVCPVRDRPRHQKMASHFYCELAEEEIDRRNYRNARQLLKRAYQSWRGNVRASLLRGRVEMALENYRDAIKALLKVKRQDADFESETVTPLLECYHQIGSDKHLQKFVDRSLQGEPPVSVLLGIGDYVENRAGPRDALGFFVQQVRRKPSLRIVSRCLALMARRHEERQDGGGDADEARRLALLHEVVADYLQARPGYQCCNCGFEARSLHWLCPSCGEWGEVKPVRGMIGE